MRKASRIYKRKSRSNLETLIILIGAIIILSIAFYLAREKSYIPPETQITQKEEKETSAVAKISVEESSPEISVEVNTTREEKTVEPKMEIIPEAIKPEIKESSSDLLTISPVKTTSNKKLTSDSEKAKQEKLYTIQVGAFSSEKNAQRLANEIEKVGYKTFVVKGTNLYKVQVEEFETYKGAEEIVPKIKALGYPTFITSK